MSHRVVFDTNTVVSALLFVDGRLSWLRSHWREGGCVLLASRETVSELMRVLGYPKFRLSHDDRLELLSDYLPYCETVNLTKRCALICRNTKDQMFLDLAQSGEASVLVTGDDDLLALAGETDFLIQSSEAYRQRTATGEPMP